MVVKKLVLVALVEVELSAVKFWSVVEPRVWKLVLQRLVAVRPVEEAYGVVTKVVRGAVTKRVPS